MGGGSSVGSASGSRDSKNSEPIERQDNNQIEEETLEPKKNEREVKWPLPPEIHYADFVPQSRIDVKRYSLRPDKYERDLLSVRRSIKVTTINFPQSQKAETKRSDYTDSKLFNSANVQMMLKSTTGLSSTMAPTAEMKNLLARLNVTHVESNEIIQHRLQGLSREAERTIGLIINETTDEQNRLLEYAQEIQIQHEELYREWLQRYVMELDQWRSAELAKLHKSLEISKSKISYTLQKKLTIVNQEVESAKAQIFYEEQERQAKEADDIIADVKTIAEKNTTQHIGTSANTDIHLTIRANAGNKSTLIDSQKFSNPNYPYLE